MPDFFNSLYSSILLHNNLKEVSNNQLDLSFKREMDFFGVNHPLINRAIVDSLKHQSLYRSMDNSEIKQIEHDLCSIFINLLPNMYYTLIPFNPTASCFFNSFDQIVSSNKPIEINFCHQTLSVSSKHSTNTSDRLTQIRNIDYYILRNFIKFFIASQFFHPEGHFIKIVQLHSFITETLKNCTSLKNASVESHGLSICINFQMLREQGIFLQQLKANHFLFTQHQNSILLSIPLTLSPTEINFIEETFFQLKGANLV